MEVRHHSHTASDPDSHRGRKKWTHYFRGFLMLNLKQISRVNLLKHGLLAVVKKLK